MPARQSPKLKTLHLILEKRMGDGAARTRACAGRNTSNSVPGGIFAKNPEVDGDAMLAYKQALDGRASGRFNSSGVSGGIFGGNAFAGDGVAAAMAAADTTTQQGRHAHPQAPPDAGPILGGGGMQARLGGGAGGGAAGGPSSNARPDGTGHTRGNLRGAQTGGGGGKDQPRAGGRSSNARPDGVGHTRGNLHGAQSRLLSERAAGTRTVEGAFAKFLERGPKALTQPYALQEQAAGSEARDEGNDDADDFLAELRLAEARDAEDTALLEQLHELEAQSGIIEAAAAQIAAEEQLDAAQQAALAQRMLAHVSEQAHNLRALMAHREVHREALASSPSPRSRQASNRRHAHRPPDGTLGGILPQERPRSAGGSTSPAVGTRHPIKGHGVCNPNVAYGSPEHRPMTRDATDGIQIMPNMGGTHSVPKYVGAAGEPSSAAWRCTHNYMAHGAEGYGDLRSEHLARQASERAAARGPNAQSGPARHLQTESKVVLGGGPAGLYPRAPSMIRGKFPGY
jgi:hypothetical protein